MNLPEIHIYCDGSCSPNPGEGGFAAVVIDATTDTEIGHRGGHEKDTTNNRMELLAAIKAVDIFLRNQLNKTIVFTDSNYVKQGLTEWMLSWKPRGWKTSSGKPVQNVDLWMELDSAWQKANKNMLEFRWVRGHDGNKWNERADVLANEYRTKIHGSKI